LSIIFHNSVAIPEVVDGKVIAAVQFHSFGVPFGNIILYNNLPVTYEPAGGLLMTINADSLEIDSAQILDPVNDHRAKGLFKDGDNITLVEITSNIPVVRYGERSATPTLWGYQTILFHYVRCEDGVINYRNESCVCFEDGTKCSAHNPPPPPPPISGSSNSETDSLSEANPSEKKSDVSQSEEETSNPVVKNDNGAVAIVLVSLTGLFLASSVVFIVLFFVK